MIKTKFLIIAIITSWLIYTSCSSSKKNQNEVQGTTLKEAYKKDFLIGTALNTAQIEEKEQGSLKLIPAQFNAISPENIMKCEVIHPKWDEYNFTMADKFVEYGKNNNMFIVGHTLVWHSQLSPFVRNIKSVDSFNTFFINHINTVASRYAGKVNSWDVVNEALNEDGTMRKSPFLDKIGDDFVVQAFKLAEKAAPNTQLYYNDYNNEQPKKRAGCIALIKKIQAAGVRIDGVGIQGHWSNNGPPLTDIENSIKEYAALGLKVAFTEVDLTALPNPWDLKGADVNQNFEGSPFMNPYPNGLPDSLQKKMAKNYEDLFALFIKYKKNISRITFWGVADGNSWLNGWPIKGRTNYPLLFDKNFLPKPAYYKVIALKAGNATGLN